MGDISQYPERAITAGDSFIGVDVDGRTVRISADEIITMLNAEGGDETTASIKAKLGIASSQQDGYLRKEDFGSFYNKLTKTEVAGEDNAYVDAINTTGLFLFTGSTEPLNGSICYIISSTQFADDNLIQVQFCDHVGGGKTYRRVGSGDPLVWGDWIELFDSGSSNKFTDAYKELLDTFDTEKGLYVQKSPALITLNALSDFNSILALDEGFYIVKVTATPLNYPSVLPTNYGQDGITFNCIRNGNTDSKSILMQTGSDVYLVDRVGTNAQLATMADIVSGTPGKSAYEIAVENGYEGTEEQWLASLISGDGSYGQALDNTFASSGNFDILGENICVNGTFTDDTWWTEGNTELTIVAGAGHVRQILGSGYGYLATPNNILTLGKSYRVTGKCRGDGTYKGLIKIHGVTLFTGTESTEWQDFSFDVTIDATTQPMYLYNNVASGTGTEFTEWDDITIKEIISESSVGTLTLTTNQMVVIGTVLSGITVTMALGTQAAGHTNEYLSVFTTGETSITLVHPENVTWDNTPLVPSANTSYILSYLYVSATKIRGKWQYI